MPAKRDSIFFQWSTQWGEEHVKEPWAGPQAEVETWPLLLCVPAHSREEEWNMALRFPGETGEESLDRLNQFWKDCEAELARIDTEIRPSEEIPRLSIGYADLIKLAVQVAGRFQNGADAIRFVFGIALASIRRDSARKHAMREKSRFIPPPPCPPPNGFPVTLREFSLIGAYKDRFTAAQKLRQFLQENNVSELIDSWRKEGISEADWNWWAGSWTEWSERKKHIAKTRSGLKPTMSK